MEKLVGGLPDDLLPGSPVAYTCFGNWENLRTCVRIDEAEDPLDGCSQSIECRCYTLESNPPTTRFRVKPRRDGRFELQQFRDFIGTHTTYQLEIEKGEIAITFPGGRSVPKSRRFFLHVKHVEEAKLSLEAEFELVVTLDRMVLHQVSDEVAEAKTDVRAKVPEDPEARRKRIADRLKVRASGRMSRDTDIDDDFDFDIDLDELDEDSNETPANPEGEGDVVSTSSIGSDASESDPSSESDSAESDDDEFPDLEDVTVDGKVVFDSDLDDEDRVPAEDEENEEGEGSDEGSDTPEVAAEEAKAEKKPAKAKAEKKPAKAKAEKKPAKAKAETKPAKAKAETKPAKAKAETKPAKAKAETKPAKAKAEKQPAKAKAEKKPAKAKAETKPAKAKAETKPVKAKAETKPAKAKKKPSKAKKKT